MIIQFISKKEPEIVLEKNIIYRYLKLTDYAKIILQLNGSTLKAMMTKLSI